MPHFGPINRRDLIAVLRRTGFEGPYSGGDHQYMTKHNWETRAWIPNPHRGDISTGLLKKFYDRQESHGKNGKSYSSSLGSSIIFASFKSNPHNLLSFGR